MNVSSLSPNKPPSFQFSLAAVFVVVTGVSIALSLMACNFTLGTMAAILLVGGGWSAVAMHAGRRKLAYSLAAAALGVIGHLVLALPLAFLLHTPLEELTNWRHGLLVMLMSVSTMLAATMLRRTRDRPVLAGLMGVFLTASIFSAIGGPIASISNGRGTDIASKLEEAVIVLVAAPLAGAAVATITLPLTWPVAIVFAKVLASIDPPEDDWPPNAMEVLEAIQTLSGRGAWPVTLRSIMRAMGRSAEAIQPRLDYLETLGRIAWTEGLGWRPIDSANELIDNDSTHESA